MPSPPPLSINQLAHNLINKGLKGEHSEIVETLHRVGYYRLKGYWFDWRNANGDLSPPASLDLVTSRYELDREISGILFGAISVLETAIRATVVESFYKEFPGEPAPHLRPSCLDFYARGNKNREEDKLNYVNWCKTTKQKQKKSCSQIAEHYCNNYPNMDIPLWAAVELMSFSDIMRLLKFNRKVKNECAKRFCVHGIYFIRIGYTAVALRNKIAHHERVWNAKFQIKKKVIKYLYHRYPVINSHLPYGNLPGENNYSLFFVCIIIQMMLAPVTQDNIANPLSKLLMDYPDALMDDMGFPQNWQDIFDKMQICDNSPIYR